MTPNYGCDMTFASPDGTGRTDLLVVEVEGPALGISLTEHQDSGIGLRRVCAEIRDVEAIRTIHKALGAYLERHGRD